MNQTQQTSLAQLVNQLSFDPIERKLYGHDIAAMPSLVKPFIGSTFPDAVVQPQNEEELIALCHWAALNHIPLTPRGKASSGYGGVLPIKKGVVVDFYRMKAILSVDASQMTVTVQPGISWEQLDKKLQPLGLTLRLYPSSYPSSTVGGWLAQGGAGFGSYEYGFFRDNVVSARVILPDGTPRDFSGTGLDLVSEAEGITGLISQVTLYVQPLEPMTVVSLAAPDAQALQKLAEDIIAADLPIWSMMFINPKMAELRNKAPLKLHHDQPVGEHTLLPLAYILTLAYRTRDAEVVDDKLPFLMLASKAIVLSKAIANHEWENRFKLMLVKRLGPSLVPTEVILPLSKIARAMDEIGHKVAQPLVKEGVILRKGSSGKPEVVILGFIPSDERQLSYNFVFALSLSVINIAESYGGRAYSTGLYFSKKAEQVLGKDRVQKLRQFKAQNDPENLLNPGKVIGNEMIGNLLELAGTFEPVARALGNSVKVEIAERPPLNPVRGIPADVAWYAYACSQCGYCVDECDQFYGRGWESQSPRGKWYWLREYMEGHEEWNQKMVDSFIACTTCELCNDRCSASLPIEPSWMKMRGLLIEDKGEMTFPAFEMMKAALHDEGDIWAGYRKDRGAWFPKDLHAKHGPEHQSKAVYFAGCTASYVEQDIGIASVRLLDAAGVDFTYLGQKESCCATPMLVAGKWDEFAQTMKKNIQAIKDAGADTVITSCPACHMMWKHTYPAWAQKLGIEYSIKTLHYSEIVSEKIQSGEFKFPANQLTPQTVTWHDSCHLGRVSGIYEAPRNLIKAIPNITLVEMAHNREEGHCCGSVLTLIKEPLVAAEIGQSRLQEVAEAGSQNVLALCPCCEFQLRVSAQRKNLPIAVTDLSAFAAKALGFELPDPHPEVQRQWAVFEAMIALMSPKGFAELMGTMWPELIDAMPLGMGGMMHFMGKAMPWSLDLMKPLFPVLFPILLPKMMPKVMPTMLERVGEAIPMPDYMAEQMPAIMPRVMDALMPHMIGDVVPLITQPMIHYLSGPSK